jgi:arylsulfatase A
MKLIHPVLQVALCLVVLSGVLRAEKPNLVVILADDMGVNDLGCYGRSGRRTPHLDRLAADGKRFTAAYAQAVCSPSRAALLTGLHPARVQITNFLPGRADWPGHRLLQPALPDGLGTDRLTLAERLREQGYATACVGKWHLGARPPLDPASRGFDGVFSGKANTQPSQSEGGKGEFGQASKAIEFLEKNSDRPFFLYLAMDNPHVPLAAQADRIQANEKGYHPVYDAMVETLDAAVGRVLERVDTLGLREKTMVVFASDNGGLHIPEIGFAAPTHNSPYRAGKGFLYEGGLRDPLIVRWPGRIAPGEVEVPVSLGDLTPTMLDLLGVGPMSPADFISLKPLLLGQGSLPERPLYWHMPNYTNQGGRPSGAMREGDWKLIEHFEDGRLELFDLKADPGEKRDMAAVDPARVASMRGKLEAWRRSLEAKMPRGNPKFNPSLWAECYGKVDVSQVEPKATGEATSAPLKEWRAAMDRISSHRSDGPARGEEKAGGGSFGLVQLEAPSADVHAQKLKYELAPHKDTLGFWVDPTDWVSWDCEVPQAGRYAVEVLQGCGKGSGGSMVEIQVADRALRFFVEETGHFQRFIPKRVGELELPAGRATVAVRAIEKKGSAVMDLRRLTLVRVP